MRQALKLLLPAIIPSWRFFDVITPAPVIEYAALASKDETPATWQEFRPRPAHLCVLQTFARLFWNPRWNEQLYLTTCAERLMENPNEYSVNEIATRIHTDLTRRGISAPYLQFRLVFRMRDGDTVRSEVACISPVRAA